MILKHPGAMRAFIELEKKLKESPDIELVPGYTMESDGVRITILDYNGKTDSNDPYLIGNYMKVETAGHAFFVKSIHGYVAEAAQTLGASEFESAQEAAKVLEGIENTEVVRFQLGYEDENSTTYFVSKWTEGVRLDEYLEGLADDTPEKKELEERAEIIWTRLIQNGFVDCWEHNMMYDPKSGKITVFDVHKLPQPKEDEHAELFI